MNNIGYERYDYKVAFDAACCYCDTIQIAGAHYDTNGAACQTCRKYTVRCVICHTSVRGLSSVCLTCRHGGHPQHIQEWFVDQANTSCPTGCGCNCRLYAPLL
jgi:hypothetical protein